MSNTSEIRFRLGIDGVGDVQAGANRATLSLNSIGEGARVTGQATAKGLAQAGESVDDMAQRLTGAESVYKATQRAGENMAGSLRVNVVGAAAAVSVLTGAISAAHAALMYLPKGALDYSREVEASAVGMAGIISSLTTVRGKQTDYNTAIGVSQTMIRQLSDDALRTAASSQELVSTFQGLLGPGLAAGMTLQQIRQISVTGANAIKSMGMNSMQLVQELRDLVQGGITASSSTLATALGLKDADIAKARASSEGLFAFLSRRLQGFEESSAHFGDTFSGRLAQLKEGAIRVTSAGLEPLTQALSDGAKELGQLLMKFDAAGKAQLNPQLITSIADFSEGAVSAIKTSGELAQAVYAHKDALLALWAAYVAYSLGQWASGAAVAVAAKLELAQAAHVATVAQAAEGQATGANTVAAKAQIATILQGLTLKQSEAAAQAQSAAATLREAAAREAAAAARVAELRGVVLATQSNTVNAEVVRNGLVPALRAAEVATLAKAQAEAASVASQTALAAATGRLNAAQEAATLSSRGLSTALAFVGGPVGLAVTAIAGLTFWMHSSSSAADDLSLKMMRIKRARDDLAGGKAPGQTDVAALQSQLSDLESRRDKLLSAGQKTELSSGRGSNPLNLQQLNQQIAEYSGLVKKAQDAANGAAGGNTQLGLALEATRQTWESSIAGVHTATSAQQEYEAKLSASRKSFDAYKKALEGTGASQAVLAQAQTRQIQAEKELARERDKAVQAAGRGGTATASAFEIEISKVKEAELVRQETYKQTTDTLKTQLQTRKISETEFLQGQVLNDLAAIGSKKEALNQEIEIAKKKANSRKEVAALTGQISILEAQQQTIAIKYANDYTVAIGKQAAEIEAARQKEYAAAEANILKLEESAGLAELEIELWGKGENALQLQTVARLREQLQILAGFDGSEQAIDQINREIAARERLITATEKKQTLKSADESAKESAKAWEKAADQINQSLTDALMRGFESGKGFAQNMRDTLKNMFSTMVLRPVIAASVQSVFLPSSASASGVTSQGGMGSISALVGGNFGGGYTAGFGAYNSEGGVSGALDAAKLAWQAGNKSGAAGTYAGVGASYAGGAMAGYSAGKLVSDGYSVSGNSGNQAVLVGTAIGAVVGGPLGAAVGGAIGGAVNRAFGMQQKKYENSYISGTVSSNSADVVGKQEWTQKGGWFRSDRSGTNTIVNSQTIAVGNELNAQVQSTFGLMGVGLGALTGKVELNNSALENFSLGLGGLGAKFEMTQEGVTQALGYTSDAVVRHMLPALAAFQQSGETLTQTATRLIATVGAVDTAAAKLNANNLQSLGTGIGNATAKQALVDLFGGADAFSSATSSYYQAFYSGAEQAAGNARVLQASFAQLNVAMPASSAEFRALVEAQDVTTDAGRRMYAQLVQLASAFDASEQAAQTYKALIAELGGSVAAGGAGVDLGATLAGSTDAASAASAALGLLDEQLAALSAQLRSAGVADAVTLQQQLQDLTVSRYKAELNLAQALYDKAKSTLTAISAERDAIASAQQQISPKAVMTPAEISAAIYTVSVGVLPSNSGVLAAQQTLSAANLLATSWAKYQTGLDSANSTVTSAQTAFNDALGKTTAAKNNVDSVSAANGGYTAIYDVYSFAKNATEAKDYITSAIEDWRKYQPEIVAPLEKFRDTIDNYFSSKDTLAAAKSAQADYVANNTAPAGTQADAAAAQAAAQAALNTATQAYYDAINTYVADASKGVSKLQTLREETLKYYQAQAALAQQMTQSAASLRAAVASAKYADLTPAEQLANLQGQFNAAFTSASSASGADLATYADKLAALVSPLLEKAKEVSSVDYLALREQVLKQSELIAAKLEDTTPTDYAKESLALLNQLDTALEGIAANTKSAQDAIVEAINASRDKTVDGLRALIAAVKGETVPAFAAGGYHSGGLRLVGERGPELEATGSSRIWTAEQTAKFLAGGGGQDQAGATIMRSGADPTRQAAQEASRQQRVLNETARLSAEAAQQHARTAEAINGLASQVRSMGERLEQSNTVAADRVISAVRDAGMATARGLGDVRQAVSEKLDQVKDQVLRQGRATVEAIDAGGTRRAVRAA